MAAASAVTVLECLQLRSGLCWRKYLNFPTLLLFQDLPGYRLPLPLSKRKRVRRHLGAKQAIPHLLCLHLAWIFWVSLLPGALTNAQTMQTNRAVNIYYL